MQYHIKLHHNHTQELIQFIKNDRVEKIQEKNTIQDSKKNTRLKKMQDPKKLQDDTKNSETIQKRKKIEYFIFYYI